MPDTGNLQRRQLAAHLLVPILQEAEDKIVLRAVSYYQASRLTGEHAMGIIGELSSLRMLRLTAEADAKRAQQEL